MNSVIVSQPSYSIGNSKRFALRSSIYNQPGPASYNIPKETNRSLSFSKARKNSKNNYENPGPASYNTPGNLGNGPKAIIISRKSVTQNDAVPGPGDYFPTALKRNISYSIRSKSSGKISENIPGPGSYSGNPIKPNSPRATIGRARRLSMDFLIENPGPGSYENNRWEKVTNPNYSFSHTSRDGFLSHTSRKSSTSSRVPTTNEITPGPGDYTTVTNTYKLNSPRAVIGTSPRDSILGSGKEGPGPGVYTPQSGGFAPRFSFSREQKTRGIKLAIPGPGQYEIPTTIGSVRSSTSLNNTLT